MNDKPDMRKYSEFELSLLANRAKQQNNPTLLRLVRSEENRRMNVRVRRMLEGQMKP